MVKMMLVEPPDARGSLSYYKMSGTSFRAEYKSFIQINKMWIFDTDRPILSGALLYVLIFFR